MPRTTDCPVSYNLPSVSVLVIDDLQLARLSLTVLLSEIPSISASRPIFSFPAVVDLKQSTFPTSTSSSTLKASLTLNTLSRVPTCSSPSKRGCGLRRRVWFFSRTLVPTKVVSPVAHSKCLPVWAWVMKSILIWWSSKMESLPLSVSAIWFYRRSKEFCLKPLLQTRTMSRIFSKRFARTPPRSTRASPRSGFVTRVPRPELPSLISFLLLLTNSKPSLSSLICMRMLKAGRMCWTRPSPRLWLTRSVWRLWCRDYPNRWVVLTRKSLLTRWTSAEGLIVVSTSYVVRLGVFPLHLRMRYDCFQRRFLPLFLKALRLSLFPFGLNGHLQKKKKDRIAVFGEDEKRWWWNLHVR